MNLLSYFRWFLITCDIIFFCVNCFAFLRFVAELIQIFAGVVVFQIVRVLYFPAETFLIFIVIPLLSSLNFYFISPGFLDIRTSVLQLTVLNYSWSSLCFAIGFHLFEKVLLHCFSAHLLTFVSFPCLAIVSFRFFDKNHICHRRIYSWTFAGLRLLFCVANQSSIFDKLDVNIDLNFPKIFNL